jgi:ABC-type multidrug transport system fused ATPase/permease subunit
MSRRRGRPAGHALLWHELRARRAALVRIGLWSVVESLPTLLSGLVVAAAMDRFLARDVAGGLGVLALLLAAAAVGAVATRQLFALLAAVVEPVRDGFITAVVQGAVTEATGSDHRLDTAGVARLTGQVQAVRNMLFGLLRSVRQTAFTFLAALVGLALLAPVVALAAALFIGLALALLALVIPGLAARHRALLLADEEVARRAGTVFGGVRDAIACAGEDQAVREVGRAVDDQVTLARALARATALRSLVVFVGGHLPLLGLLVAAPWLLRAGHLSFGELVGAATYLTASLEPALRNLVDVVGGWGLDLAVTLRRLGEGFARPEPAPDAALAPAPDRHDLAVRGLTFAYGPDASPVVRDLDVTVPAGGHVAIVGSSGIGKSTLANLLAGLLVPQGGAVLLGGRAVERIRAADLRRVVGLIPQEAYIFAGTLRENLIYLAPRATAPQVARAVAEVGMEPLVGRLGGLDALVGAGGAELSQGERQLVALARVYLSPARVVILDEATANVDPEAEARAEAAFARRAGTLVVIAHRISSARRADQVLLLDGERVYLGSHDELLRSSSRYSDLVGHWDEADRPVSLPA